MCPKGGESCCGAGARGSASVHRMIVPEGVGSAAGSPAFSWMWSHASRVAAVVCVARSQGIPETNFLLLVTRVCARVELSWV